MHGAAYERGMNGSRLVMDAVLDWETEADSVEMLHYNKIPGFLPMHKLQNENGIQFAYDITGKMALSQIVEMKEADAALLKKILYGFDYACEQAENYMLYEGDILLEPEFIFAEAGMEGILFCYQPGIHFEVRQQFQQLMEYLLQHVDHQDGEAVKLVYCVYQRITEEEGALHQVLQDCNLWEKMPENMELSYLSGHSFGQRKNLSYEKRDPLCEKEMTAQDGKLIYQKELVVQRNQTIMAQEAAEGLPEKGETRQGHKKEVKQKGQRKNPLSKKEKKQHTIDRWKNYLHRKIYTDDYMETEDIVYEEDSEEEPSHPTVCLTQEMKKANNCFIYQGMERSRDFVCTKERTILGSNPREVDICIPLPMISRIHAKVEIEENGTSIEDLNSTNGTLVNGEMLQYREKRYLQKGDMIGIAGEYYSFN